MIALLRLIANGSSSRKTDTVDSLLQIPILRHPLLHRRQLPILPEEEVVAVAMALELHALPAPAIVAMGVS